MSNLEIALKLVQGETVQRKYLKDVDGVKRVLKSFKINATTVIKQLDSI